MAQSKVTLHSALNRTESRGAHAREDFKERDDKNWLVHTICRLNNNLVELSTRDVIKSTLNDEVDPIPLAKRVY